MLYCAIRSWLRAGWLAGCAGELEDKLVDIDVGQKLNLDLSGMGQQVRRGAMRPIMAWQQPAQRSAASQAFKAARCLKR